MPEPTSTISVPSEDPKRVEKKANDASEDASKKKDDPKAGEDLVSVKSLRAMCSELTKGLCTLY